MCLSCTLTSSALCDHEYQGLLPNDEGLEQWIGLAGHNPPGSQKHSQEAHTGALQCSPRPSSCCCPLPQIKSLRSLPSLAYPSIPLFTSIMRLGATAVLYSYLSNYVFPDPHQIIGSHPTSPNLLDLFCLHFPHTFQRISFVIFLSHLLIFLFLLFLFHSFWGKTLNPIILCLCLTSL